MRKQWKNSLIAKFTRAYAYGEVSEKYWRQLDGKTAIDIAFIIDDNPDQRKNYRHYNVMLFSTDSAIQSLWQPTRSAILNTCRLFGLESIKDIDSLDREQFNDFFNMLKLL